MRGGWGGGEVCPTSPPPHIPASVKGLLPEGHSCGKGEEARRSAAFPDAHEAPFHEKVALAHAHRDAAPQAEREFRLTHDGPRRVDLDVVRTDAAEDVRPRHQLGPDVVDHAGEPAVQLGVAGHGGGADVLDRKSTRLNSSHGYSS